MRMEIVLVTFVILTILIIIVRQASYRKKALNKRIENIYVRVNSLLGHFIEKWDEEKIISDGKVICDCINQRKYSHDIATNFINYYNAIAELIYKNNLKVLETRIGSLMNKYDELSGNGKSYIISTDLIKLTNNFQVASKEIVDKAYKYDSSIIRAFLDVAKNTTQYFSNMNIQYMDNEKKQCKSMFDNIEKKCLDENQRTAVVNDDLRQLVVAGAGSGKTLTMAAKVKYLVERKNINPKDILLISFTKKSANEMEERIHKIGIDIESSTFHKYGLGILGKIEGKTPKVYEDIKDSVDTFLRDVIYTNEEDTKNFLRLLGILMLPSYKPNQTFGEMIQEDRMFDLTTLKGMYESNVNSIKLKKLDDEINMNQKKIDKLNKKIDESLNEEEFHKYRKLISSLNKIIIDRTKQKLTIRNEKVKSREEVKIANILFLNGIDYEYEAEYPYDEDNNYRKKYCPDFYLVNDDVYLEHFGIDRNGHAPQYDHISERRYIDGVQWKEKLHKLNNTHLIKTYSWQFNENTIEDDLKKEFKKFGIKTKKVDFRQVVQEIVKSETNIDAIESLINLLITFISLFKSNNFSVAKFDDLMYQTMNLRADDWEEKNGNLELVKERNTSFLKFAKSFYIYYTDFLRENKMIDFNDMINHATKLIQEGIYTPNYKYVIVDEYQDISMGRYKLIKATLEKSGAKLFCVGDDWQSIYRFTGSEVNLFVDFVKYYGLFSKTDIVATYRNSQELLDITGEFITMNSQQIKKNLQSAKKQQEPLRIKVYVETSNIISDEGEDRNIFSINEAFDDALADILVSTPNTQEVLVLGRNNRDINMLKEHKKIQIKQLEGDTIILHENFSKIKIKFLTVHRSKGLEADNVIVLNLLNSRHGFPNQIADDPVLDLLHDNKESYPFAEERRLFYVALTRTKNITYLLVPNNNYSRFIDDLYELTKNKNNVAKELKDVPYCPVCKTGTLVKRKASDNHVFVGCSNYPVCTYTVNNVAAIKKENRCPICNNFLVKRNGKYGEFMGCLSYPACKYTHPL